MKQNKKQGFTIIEVVLVLAIAALIFLMIFVALPTLQASQRDSSKKQDAALVATAVSDYASAYKRPLTGASSEESNLRQYVEKLDQHPDNGDAVELQAVNTNLTNVPTEGDVWVHPRAKCDGPNAVSGSSRDAAVRVRLENDTSYCIDATQ